MRPSGVASQKAGLAVRSVLCTALVAAAV